MSLGSSEGSVQFWGFIKNFITLSFLWSYSYIVNPLLNPKAGGAPLVDCLWQLVQYIHSYSVFGGHHLHLESEDAPYHDDKGQFFFCIYVKVLGLSFADVAASIWTVF
jgi:hypothetical protein